MKKDGYIEVESASYNANIATKTFGLVYTKKSFFAKHITFNDNYHIAHKYCAYMCLYAMKSLYKHWTD